MSRAVDHRINSTNLYVEISFGEYLSFAKSIIANNDLQRKRVKTSKTVYSLLKNDLKKGCIMPPLVLAVAKKGVINPQKIENEELLAYMKAHNEDVLILDGLQRTYTLIDAALEVEKENPQDYNDFLNYTLRLEIYIEINKFGILYRMLTLNTGQTPMTARHQLEMLYKDMLYTDMGSLQLVTDVQDRPDPSKNEFAFKNVIDGFNSFLNRNELPIDREDLLENIKMLENMSSEQIDQDLFVEFINCYALLFHALRETTNDRTYSKDEIQDFGISNTPFGYSVHKAFATSQALTGFGAAIGRMKDLDIIRSFNQISDIVIQLPEKNDTADWFEEFLVKMDAIKNEAKKIGNAQRMFLQYFFRELLNQDTDSYLNLSAAVDNGYRKYRSQM